MTRRELKRKIDEMKKEHRRLEKLLRLKQLLMLELMWEMPAKEDRS